MSLEFSPDGRYLAIFLQPLSIYGYSGLDDMEFPGEFYLCDLNTPDAEPRVLAKHENAIANVAFFHKSPRMVSFSNDSHLIVWKHEQGLNWCARARVSCLVCV